MMFNDRNERELICEVGRRLYNRGFAAANDGNISIRIAENRFLCTPTGVSKGFMKPEDLCIVDSNGDLDPNHETLKPDRTNNWVAVWRKSAADALLHVQAGKKERLHGFVLEYPREDGGCLDTPRKHLAALGVKLNMSEAIVRPVTGTRKFHFNEGKWDKELEHEDFDGAKP